MILHIVSLKTTKNQAVVLHIILPTARLLKRIKN